MPDLPSDLRHDLAQGALAGEFGGAAAAARVFERVHGRGAARKWRRILKKRAPTLFAALRWDVPEEGRSWTFVLFPFASARGWLAFVVLSLLFKVATGRLDCDGGRPDQPAPSILGRSQVSLDLPHLQRASALAEETRQVCASVAGDPRPCDAARKIALTLSSGDCFEIRERWREAARAQPRQFGTEQELIRRLGAFALEVCPR